MTKIEEQNALQNATFEELVREMLTRIGEDPQREGLLATPGRVTRAWEALAKGYTQSVESVLNNALFTVEYNEMVIVKDIEMFSMC